MYHCQVKAGAKGKGASATKHADYIMREGDYKNHDDLEHVGYGNMPSFANTNAGEIWRLSDKYEGANRTVYRELELGFPLETKKQDRIDMVEKLMSNKFKGHAFTYAIHDKEGNPHAHVMFCDRKQDGIERTAEQFFMRANKKNPEKGGCAKAEELNGKDRGDHVEKIRKSWADRHNDFYKSIGSEERADHRTLAAQRDSFLQEAKEFEAMGFVESRELAAEATRKAALLDRPADKRISRKEWHRLQKSGELEQIKEERAANRELAESKAQIIDLQAEREKRPVPQVQPVQKSEQVKQEPVSPVKPVVAAVPPPTQREARPLPPETKTNPPIQQPPVAVDVQPVQLTMTGVEIKAVLLDYSSSLEKREREIEAERKAIPAKADDVQTSLIYRDVPEWHQWDKQEAVVKGADQQCQQRKALWRQEGKENKWSVEKGPLLIGRDEYKSWKARGEAIDEWRGKIDKGLEKHETRRQELQDKTNKLPNLTTETAELVSRRQSLGKELSEVQDMRREISSAYQNFPKSTEPYTVKGKTGPAIMADKDLLQEIKDRKIAERNLERNHNKGISR